MPEVQRLVAGQGLPYQEDKSAVAVVGLASLLADLVDECCFAPKAVVGLVSGKTVHLVRAQRPW